MKAWREDQLQTLASIQCERELFELLVSLAQQLGFDYCAYGLRVPLPFSQPRTILFNNYPVAWQERYRERGYVAIDPTVRHGLCSVTPIVWSDEVFAGAPRLWEEARAFGLDFGWALASRDANGVSGMLTLARSHEVLSAAELAEKIFRMSWLAHVTHVGFSRCLTAKLIPEATVRLSSREAEVLRWTAEGKTSGEISRILNVSERTINFHITNAMIKLNAVNKTAATIRAAVLGLLY